MAEVVLYNEAECEQLIRDVEASGLVSAGGRLPEHWEKLTLSQRRIYAVRVSTNPPLSARETARALGLAPTSIEKRWTEIRRITGIPDVTRVNVENLPAGTIEIDDATPTQITKMARRRIYELMQGLDRSTQAEMSGRDKGQAAAALTKVAEYWMQRPAELRRMKDRKHAAELLAAVVAELAKHGVQQQGDTLKLESRPVLDAEVVDESA